MFPTLSASAQAYSLTHVDGLSFSFRYLPMRPEVLNGTGALTQVDGGGASARQRRSQPAALSGIGAAFDRSGH